MENKDKYYTPSIEEFYIGFEYYLHYDDGDQYIKGIHDGLITKENYDEFVKYRNLGVKYLDKEDIEELGFKFEKDHSCELEFSFKECYLTYDSLYYLRIAWYGDGDTTRFSGTIKNKSELKVLMKQLGI